MTFCLKNSKGINRIKATAFDSPTALQTICNNLSKLKNVTSLSTTKIKFPAGLHHLSKFGKKLKKLRKQELSIFADILSAQSILRYTELLTRAKLTHLNITFLYFLHLFNEIGILKPLISCLKKLNTLEALHITPSLVPVFGELYTEIAQVYSVLPKLKSLSITLDQDPFCNSYLQGITASIKNLKNLDKLVYLDIIVSWNFKIFIAMEKLFKTVASLKKLNLLYIMSNKEKRSDFEDWQLLTQGFDNLKKLESLSMDFSQCKEILEDYMNCLPNKFKDNNSIKSLTINFYDHRRYANYHTSLIQFISNLKRIKSIEIGSHGRYAFENNFIKEFAEGVKEMKLLEVIKLDFKFSKCNNKAIKILCEGLSHLENLKKLRMNFTGTAVTNGCIKLLNRFIMTKKNLTELGIMLKHIMIDDKLFEELCLSTCRNLKSPTKIKFKYSDYIEDVSDEIIWLHQKRPLCLRYIIEDVYDDI